MTGRWIPNVLTAFNLFAGLASIGLAVSERWIGAALLIFAAALFDTLDGRIARRVNAVSILGKKLDAMADWISFGIAPAVMAYLLDLTDLGWNGFILMILFPVCGAVRLIYWRNISTRNYFVGLPIAVAGTMLAAIAFIGCILPYEFMALVIIALSGLMVSTVKFPKI